MAVRKGKRVRETDRNAYDLSLGAVIIQGMSTHPFLCHSLMKLGTGHLRKLFEYVFV